MTQKYFLGYNEVSYDAFEEAKSAAEQEGNTIAGKVGDAEYQLQNGTVIKGNKDGGFNRIENGEAKEAWQVGTINDFVEGESTGDGEALFFFRKD